MIKFFKRAARKAVAAFEPLPTVEEIHGAFDSASQRALEEANSILGGIEDQEMEIQANMLKKAGFEGVPLISEWNGKKKERLEAREKVRIVEKYAHKYPNNKFIFIDQVKEICKKYGLLCVPVSKYKGEVPRKNLDEILKFKAQLEDIYHEDRSFNFDRVQFDFSQPQNFRNEAFLQEDSAKYNAEVSEYHRIDMQARLDNIRFSPRPYPRNPRTGYVAVPLFICAPKGDVIIESSDKQHNEVFVTREIKDPIVLHFVKDGFLILSKWGPEASDPSLLNEKMN